MARSGRAYPIQPILIGGRVQPLGPYPTLPRTISAAIVDRSDLERRSGNVVVRPPLAAAPPVFAARIPTLSIVSSTPRRQRAGAVRSSRLVLPQLGPGLASGQAIGGRQRRRRPPQAPIFIRGISQTLGPYPVASSVQHVRAQRRPVQEPILLRVVFVPAAAPSTTPLRTVWIVSTPKRAQRSTAVRAVQGKVDTFTFVMPPRPRHISGAGPAGRQAKRPRLLAPRFEFAPVVVPRAQVISAAFRRSRPGRVVVARGRPDVVRVTPRAVVVRLAMTRPGRRLLRLLHIQSAFAPPPSPSTGDTGGPGYGLGSSGGTGVGGSGGDATGFSGGVGTSRSGGYGNADSGGTGS